MAIKCSKPVVYNGEDANMADEPRVRMTIDMPLAKAQELAAHKRERGPLDILAPEAKEVGEPTLQALVDANIDRRSP